MNLGTVLPTRASLKRDEIYAREQELKALDIGRSLERKGLTRRTVEGETRYYSSDTEYTIISTRDFSARTFVKKSDGWYAKK